MDAIPRSASRSPFSKRSTSRRRIAGAAQPALYDRVADGAASLGVSESASVALLASHESHAMQRALGFAKSAMCRVLREIAEMSGRPAGRGAIFTGAANGFVAGPPLRGLTSLREVGLRRNPKRKGASTP
jgi:hypothetical protein